MSLAGDLRSVLSGAAAVLRSQGTEDVATMAEQAAGILAAHLAGDVTVAEDAAVRLVGHLFRGSAAAGAIQSMPPAAEAPAAEAEPAAPADAPEPAAVAEQVVQPPPQPDPQPEPADEPEPAETVPGAVPAAVTIGGESTAEGFGQVGTNTPPPPDPAASA